MPMIETVNLTKKYGELVALNNLNLQIEEGACCGFIGPNGAVKILATLLKPTWGEARIDGKTVGYQNPLIRPVIGYVPDFMGAYDDMLVTEYLQFFAACYGIHGDKRERAIRDVLALTDLNYKAESEVNGLSRGMQQRLSVARVLLHDPKVLLMDEPASGLDPRARIEMRELLKELRRMGKTIIISSHILHELADICNTVAIIERGELIYAGSVRDIMQKVGSGTVVQVTVEDRHADAADLLGKVPGVAKVQVVQREGQPPRLDVVLDAERPVAVSDLPARLVTAGFRLVAMHEEPVNLETAFMRLTKGMVA
jgi:ABC-2 type transport system ATP-binding protein